ncbi:MAG: hypothetical protein LBQ39_01905 [Tannerellaceae bacterium]|nr:hypothetical protein [Tannerellaceae bacterium]
MEYGIINENGYLVSRDLSDRTEEYRNESGEIETRTITVEDQIGALGGWKPVDAIDESLLECEDGYIIRLIPYDAGDHISYEYNKVFDVQGVRKKIKDAKDLLSDGDYKIIKCYEATLLGDPLPYDITELHANREMLRGQINEMETILSQHVSDIEQLNEKEQ